VVPPLVTSLIELAVGIGCLGAAALTWGHRTLRVFALLFAVGGALAAGHALWALATR
jgi:hypothetical protein